MGRLLLAPGDVLADGQGFARVGSDGRVLVTNAQDQCPECGCGGDVGRVCCAGGIGLMQDSLPSRFPCDFTPSVAGEPPLLDWCLGTGQLRHTLNRATRTARSLNPLAFGASTLETEDVEVLAPVAVTTGRSQGAPWSVNQTPATGQRRSQTFGPSPSDQTFMVNAANVQATIYGLTALNQAAAARTGRIVVGGSTCAAARTASSLLDVVVRYFGPGSFSGLPINPPVNTADRPSGTHTGTDSNGAWTMTIARQWSAVPLSASLIRVRAVETVSFRQTQTLGPREFDLTYDTEWTTETLSPCPPVGGLSVGGEVENPTRWMGLEWEGEPMPLRVLNKLVGRPSSGCGCGCIRPLKRLWRRLLGAVPHPASA
jgi:hypothetical protein